MLLTKEQLWDAFVADPESKGYSTMVDCMKGKDSVTEVNVPGCDPDERYLKPTDLARLTALAILKWIIALHSFGWSLNGEISSDDFIYIAYCDFKVKKDKMKFLKRCKIKRKRKDMESIAQVIHDGIFKGSVEIPSDFQHLLWLLRHYKNHYEKLILTHPSILKESDSLGFFRALYMRLQPLANLDPAKYNRNISQIPYCQTNEDHWKLRCQHNKHLMKILQPLSGQGQPPLAAPGTQPSVAAQINSVGPDYDSSADGLLKFLLDSYWIIIDHSVGDVKVKKGQKKRPKIVLFKHYQLQHMFSAAFAQVICRFAKAMHAENELVRLHGPSLRELM